MLVFPVLTLTVLNSPSTVAASSHGLVFSKTWGTSGEDIAQGVAVDSSGNAYLVGYNFNFSVSSDDAILLKYNSSGSLLWQRMWGDKNGTDIGYGIAVDPAGYVYATGYTTSYCAPSPCSSLFLLKVDPMGNPVWERTWGFGGNEGLAVAPDSSGNVYVIGNTAAWGRYPFDLLILKFNSTGGLLWWRSWGGEGVDNAGGLVLDSSGNVYVTGYTESSGAGGVDVLLLKFSSTGALLWQRTWGGVRDDAGQSVAIDPAGNIYIEGWTSSFGAGGQDIFVLKLNSEGSLLWQRTWGGSGGEGASGVAFDRFGNAVVAGSTNSFSNGRFNALLLIVDQSGNLIRGLTWGRDGDYSTGVAADSSGEVVVTGTVSETPPYGLGSIGNNTLGRPAYAFQTPSFSADSFNFPPYPLDAPLLQANGSETYAGGADFFLFKYLFAPTVRFLTSPGVGSITFNGTAYTDGQSGDFTYANVTATANPPAGYTFRSWSATGGVSIVSPSSSPTTVTVLGPGILQANFTRSVPIQSSGLLIAALTPLIVRMLGKRRVIRTSFFPHHT